MNFQSTFSLSKFLKDKGKKHHPTILIYQQLRCLRNYSLINSRDELGNLKIGSTYIKFIANKDLFVDDNYRSHVNNGGILLSGGYYSRGRYVETDTVSDWKVLCLKYTTKTTKKSTIYYMHLNANKVFYKLFGNALFKVELIGLLK